MLAFIFPGQGAQTIGMGQEVAQAYPAAKAVFQEVDEALEQNLSALIWSGTQEELTLTENAQPALMAVSIAVLRALEAEGVGIDAASYVAGHSLGEYSALTAAGALSLADTAKLLRIRGKAMQEAVPPGKGAMIAILGMDMQSAQKIAQEAAEGEICQLANDNDTAQAVLSGDSAAIARAGTLAKAKGAKRVVPLSVSAPFHCDLMLPAAKKMARALEGKEIKAPCVPLISNVLAHNVKDPTSIRSLLVEQITHSVRWRESIIWMRDTGVKSYWEIGAGKALSGMVRRIDRAAQTRALGTVAEIKEAVGSL